MNGGIDQRTRVQLAALAAAGIDIHQIGVAHGLSGRGACAGGGGREPSRPRHTHLKGYDTPLAVRP